MLNHLSVTRLPVKKIQSAGILDIADDIVVEEPLEIQLDYGPYGARRRENISVTMRTPGNDIELAAGFLFSENIIQRRSDIIHISPLSDTANKILAIAPPDAVIAPEKISRNFYSHSGCGICGKTSMESIRTFSPGRNESTQVSKEAGFFFAIQQQLIAHQSIFESTGGLHAAAIFDGAGEMLVLREDIGRHNALDKVIGFALFNDLLPLDQMVLLLSGRAGFELVQKAAMAGIKIVCAVGAPSSLAIEFAKECDMTLVGFLREQRFNIYSGEQRILVDHQRA